MLLLVLFVVLLLAPPTITAVAIARLFLGLANRRPISGYQFPKLSPKDRLRLIEKRARLGLRPVEPIQDLPSPRGIAA